MVKDVTLQTERFFLTEEKNATFVLCYQKYNTENSGIVMNFFFKSSLRVAARIRIYACYFNIHLRIGKNFYIAVSFIECVETHNLCKKAYSCRCQHSRTALRIFSFPFFYMPYWRWGLIKYLVLQRWKKIPEKVNKINWHIY